MTSEVSTSYPVSGINPFSQNSVTQGRTYGNQADLSTAIRQLFGEMPHLKEVTAYENTTQTNQQLPYYFIGQSAYLQEKVKGLTNRSGGWMTDDVLKWAYTRQITFQWDEYHFEHTLVGRVPHQGVPRVVKSGRKVRTERSKRHGIGFVMDASELTTTRGIQQYQNNIRGIVACILETVYLNSIYALQDAADRKVREHMATNVSQTSIFDDFDTEIEDYASISKNPQGLVETVTRKYKLLDMVGAQRVFLITTPESGIYMSQLRTFQKPDPGYLTQGPDAQFSKPTQFYDFVIGTNNGPINVYTARDLRTGERGNFIKPLYSEPWIAEYFTHSARKVKNWSIWDGFTSSENTVRYSTSMRDVLIYSVSKDKNVRIPFTKSSRNSAYAHKKFLEAALKHGPGGSSGKTQWKQKHFFPSDPSTSIASQRSLAFDSFVRPDEDSFHRYAPSLLYWNREKSKAGICTHFGMMDSTAMSEKTLKAISATLGASGSFNSKTLDVWKVGVLELLDHIENTPYNEQFFEAVRGANTTGGNNTIRNTRITELSEDNVDQWKGNGPALGIMKLPEKQEGFIDLSYPPGFTGFAGLQSIAQWASSPEDSGWGILPDVASEAISKIRDVMATIDSCLESEDTKVEHRPINYIPDGTNGKLAAFVQNLVYTDRSPLFLALPGTITSSLPSQSAVSSAPLVATVTTPGGESISNAAGDSRFAIISSKAGVRNPVVSNTTSSGLFMASSAGEEAQTFASLKTRGAHESLANTLQFIRSQRDHLLDSDDLSSEEAIVEPLLSDYFKSIRDGAGSDTTEKHVAGIGAYIEEYKVGKLNDKDKYLKAVKLLKNTVDAVSGASSKSYRPSFKSIRAKGGEILSSGDNYEEPESSFIVNSSNRGFAKGLNDLLTNMQHKDKTISSAADSLLNASSTALSYSRAKWHSGNNADALLLYNPDSSSYNYAITSDNVSGLIFSDNMIQTQENNIVAAVYNYAGNDSTLKDLKSRVRTGLASLGAQSRIIKEMLNNVPSASHIGQQVHIGAPDRDISGGSDDHVMTSLFLTTGIAMNTPDGGIISTGSSSTGYTVPVSMKMINMSDKAHNKYLGALAAEAKERYIPVKTYQHSLLAAYDFGKSGGKSYITSKFDRFGGARGSGGRYETKGIAERESARREMLSSALDVTSFTGLGTSTQQIGDEFNVLPARKTRQDVLTYSMRGIRGETGPSHELKKPFDWPKGHTHARGILGSKTWKPSDETSNMDTSNYKEHMVTASQIKNPVIKTLAMAFLSSLCLREGGKDPWKRLEQCNIFTPIAFFGLRAQIQHAMENWIMGEPGYRMGANIYSHNQFIVGVDATSMMIYGNLGYYHKSLVYDEERIVLLPFVRPRKYICGSEDKFVTSERQVNLNGLQRPDIISLGISSEEGELDPAVPIIGWYKYPDMNRMMEPHQSTPAYSGYLEFRHRFPTQLNRILSGYGQRGNRTYKDMLRKFPSVAFQGEQRAYVPTGGGVGEFSDSTSAVGHRAGGCKHGCKLVWNGKRSYFPDVSLEGVSVNF